MSWTNSGLADDTGNSSGTTRPRSKFERRSSYSLERFLQETEQNELSPASSIEARHIDVKEFARRRKRMQSPSSSNAGAYTGGMAMPGAGRRPRLLLMGQRRYFFSPISCWTTMLMPTGRSGKSSISSVVFHKMPPTETLFLESTTRIQKDPIQSVALS